MHETFPAYHPFLTRNRAAIQVKIADNCAAVSLLRYSGDLYDAVRESHNRDRHHLLMAASVMTIFYFATKLQPV